MARGSLYDMLYSARGRTELRLSKRYRMLHDIVTGPPRDSDPQELFLGPQKNDCYLLGPINVLHRESP